MKMHWRRSWAGRVAWQWLRSELEIVAKVAGVVTLSLWLKRLIEQFLGAKVLNESILRGEMNDVVRGSNRTSWKGGQSMVVGGSSPATDVVIAVEPTRGGGRSWSGEARAAAVRNNGRGLRGWITEEAAWLVAQFLKVAVSIAAFRAIHQLFRSRLANEFAYRRAPELWSHGQQEAEGPGQCITSRVDRNSRAFGSAARLHPPKWRDDGVSDTPKP
jgi:hypothetical protein